MMSSTVTAVRMSPAVHAAKHANISQLTIRKTSATAAMIPKAASIKMPGSSMFNLCFMNFSRSLYFIFSAVTREGNSKPLKCIAGTAGHAFVHAHS